MPNKSHSKQARESALEQIEQVAELMRQGGVLKRIVAFMAFLFLSTLAYWSALADSRPVAVPFVIRNARVFDGERTIPRSDIVVIDGKIAAIGSGVSAPPGAEVIEGTGDTLLPGLIDSHVHIWIRPVLERSLAFGVTTVLDMFMRADDARAFRTQEADGAPDIADFRTAGTCVTSPGGHGVEEGFPIPTIRSPEEAQAFVDARIADGSDYIKIMYDFGENYTIMSRATMAAVARAAHKRGKLVVVHIDSYQGALDAINAGADGLAHTPFDRPPDNDFAALMKSHHMFDITTMTMPRLNDEKYPSLRELMADPLIAPYLSVAAINWFSGLPNGRSDLHTLLYHHKMAMHPRDDFERDELVSLRNVRPEDYGTFADGAAALRLLRNAGVPILAGDDASGDYAGALFEAELEGMVLAGLSPSEALADATSVPARIFSLKDRGRIAPGLRADLLLVRGDPTKDIHATRDIVGIWKQGVSFDRVPLREQIAQQNEAVKFGSGWMPDDDRTLKGDSKVQLKVVDGGPDHAAKALLLTCDVKRGIDLPFAGAMYSPGVAWQTWREVNYSGAKSISFWARGDGHTYFVCIFNASRGWTPSKQSFVAGKDWELHTIPLSAFRTDGSDITLISFVATPNPGQYHFELAGLTIGSGSWLGVSLARLPSIPGSTSQFAIERMIITGIAKDSPADRAGLHTRDEVVAFASEKTTDPSRVVGILARLEPGTKVPIEIVRDGKPQTLQVTIAQHRVEVVPGVNRNSPSPSFVTTRNLSGRFSRDPLQGRRSALAVASRETATHSLQPTRSKTVELVSEHCAQIPATIPGIDIQLIVNDAYGAIFSTANMSRYSVVVSASQK
jgi:imidazolonepropionase-like amidohydrolase